MFGKKFKTKRDFWLALKEQTVLEIAKIEIDLEIYSVLPDDKIVGQEQEGRTIKDKTAKEAREIKENNLAVYQAKLDAIERLLSK